MKAGALLRAYRDGSLTPSATAARVIAACARSDQPIWITRVSDDALLARARELDAADRELPLYGVPFAVKDNIDVAGMPTTAACPGFAYVPETTSPVVERLLDAGALLVGKTNLDQFATGLVGTRTPYGACWSVFDEQRLSGGSSSGSAVAVALGQVAFALGTDTAGSGRVPAAFNALVGVKPTRGLLSVRGVVPACESLDCVSLFTRDVADAACVLDVVAGVDPDDPWSRAEPAAAVARRGVIGVPAAGQVAMDEPEATAAWEAALAQAAETWELVEVDVSPLLQAAPLLYSSWVAERTTAIGDVVAAAPEGLDPTVAEIVGAIGAGLRGSEVFAAIHRLSALRAQADALWQGIDALLLPTVPSHPTHAAVAADPIGVNAGLGRFTNFVNLMYLAGLALPGPPRPDGLPHGITLLGPTFSDRRLLELGAQWAGEDVAVALPGTVRLAVAGAHLSGLPLNVQLTERGARLVRATSTASGYRLYALPGEGVARPGLIRVPQDTTSIAVEVWELTPAALGSLLTLVPAPLAIGRVTLADGEEVCGFTCEGHAAADAIDVTEYGGWRAYLDSGVAV